MDDYILNEESTVDATVHYANRIDQESWDTIDLIESGYTFNQMIAEYKANGAQKIVLVIEF